MLIDSIIMNGYTYRGSNSIILPLFSVGVNSYREEFAPLRANSMSDSYIIQWNKQEFMQVDIAFIFGKEALGGVYKRGGFY